MVSSLDSGEKTQGRVFNTETSAGLANDILEAIFQ